MAVLLTSGRWLTQPQGPVEIDWSHPLSRGLVFYTLPGGFQADLVSGIMPTRFGTVTRTAGRDGVAATTAGTATDGVGITYGSQVKSITVDFTIAAEVSVRGQVATSAILRAPYFSTTWTTPFHVFGLNRSSTTASVALGYGTAATNRSAVFTDGTFQVADNQKFIASRSGANASLVYNGNLFAPTVSNSFVAGEAVAFNTGSSITMLSRSRGTPAEGIAGDAYYGVVWNRALSDPEKLDFQSNPYQVLRPLRKKLYYGVSAPLIADVLLLDTLGGGANDSLLKEDGDAIYLESAISEGEAARIATSATTFGKLASTTFAVRGVPGRTAQVFAGLGMLSSAVLANRNLPPNASFVQALLKPLTALAAAARTIPLRTAAVAATLGKLTAAGLAARSAPGASATVAAVFGKLTAAGQAARNVPSGLGTIAASLYALRTTAFALRTSPGKTATSTARISKLIATATATRSVPQGEHPTLPHMRAPAWRTADFGDGSAPVNWLAPLDPSELKAYTIDCSRELTSSRTSRIMGISVQLSGLAIAAGLRIYGSSSDDTHVTIWFDLVESERVKVNWNPPGEVHTIVCRITASDGQIYERDAHLRVRQLGQ